MMSQDKYAIYILSLALVISAMAPVFAEDLLLLSPGGDGSGNIVMGSGPASTYSIIVPSGITDWELSPLGDGVSTKKGSMHVTADGDWRVSVSDTDSTNTKGHMTDYDGSSYVTTNYLASPMNVSVQSIINDITGYEVELPTGGNIVTGSSTITEGRDISVIFKQPVSWSDKVLSSGHSYNIVVTFTISSN